MTGQRRAKADKVAAFQFVECIDQVRLFGQPFLMARNDGLANPVGTDPEGIAPFGTASDINSGFGVAAFMLVVESGH